MWFLATLFTAVGAAFLYEKCERISTEIAVICVAVILASTIITLIAAPWPLQLGLLIVLLISRMMTTGAMT